MSDPTPRPDDTRGRYPDASVPGLDYTHAAETLRRRVQREQADRDQARDPDTLLAQAKATIPAEYHELLDRLAVCVEDHALGQMGSELDDTVERIAQHFPGLAPAIRAVGVHVFERFVGEHDRCRESVAAIQTTRRWG
jgi:hypothetical protein